MFKFKKLTAVALSAMLAFGMIGCGKDGGSSDKDKSSKKDGAVDTSKVESIYDAYDLMASYTKGSFSISADVNAEQKEKGNAKITLSGSGKTDGKNGALDKISVDVNTDDSKMSIELKDFLTIAEGRAYIDIDAVLKEFVDVDTSFGSYGLLLPEMDVNSMKDKYLELGKGAFEAFLSGAEVSGKDGDFTASFKDAEGYKKSITAVFDWLDKNKDKIEALVKESASSVDVKDYLTKLVDDIDEDLVAAADELGYGQMVNEQTIEQIKKSLEEQLDDLDVEEQLDVNLFENFEDAKKKIDEMSDEDWTKLFEGIDKSDLAIKLKVSDDSCDASVKMEFANNEGSKVNADITFSFKVEDVSIKAPSNASKLVDIAKYVKENPEIITKITAGLQEWSNELSKAFGDVSDEDWDDDEDWDWDDDDDDDWDWDDDDDEAEDKSGSGNDDDKTLDDDKTVVDDKTDWDDDDEPAASADGSYTFVAEDDESVSYTLKVADIFKYDASSSEDDEIWLTLADDEASYIYVSAMSTVDFDEVKQLVDEHYKDGDPEKPVPENVGGYDTLTDKETYVIAFFDGVVSITLDLEDTKATPAKIIDAVMQNLTINN